MQIAVPAAAILATQITAKATEVAPAKLVATITTSAGSGAKGTLTWAIAQKAGHAMTLVKIKIAAAIILAVGVVGVGTGTAIKLAGEAPSFPTAPIALPAKSAESAVPGDAQIARWDVVLTDSVARTIDSLGTPVQTASKDYRAMIFDGATLRGALAGRIGNRGVIPDPDGLGFALNVEYGDRLYFPATMQAYFENPQKSGIYFLTQSVDEINDLFQRSGSGLKLKLDDHGPHVQAGTAGPNGVQWTTYPNSAISFDGQLAAGEAVGFLGKFSRARGSNVNHLIVFEAFHAAAGESFVNQTDSGWWIRHGPATAASMVRCGVRMVRRFDARCLPNGSAIPDRFGRRQDRAARRTLPSFSVARMLVGHAGQSDKGYGRHDYDVRRSTERTMGAGLCNRPW